MTDNGKEFVVQGKETDLAKLPRKISLKLFALLPALTIARPKLGILGLMAWLRDQNYHNLQRKLKFLQNRTPYETMIEWYEKKPELFIYHPTNMTIFWKERGET